MFNIREIESKYSAQHIIPHPLTLSRGEGAYVFDDLDNRYLDMMTGVSVVNFGHNHPRLIAALHKQASKIAITSRLFHNETLGLLLRKACKLTNMDKAIPMNSGAEAVETAIKVIRKWGYIKKNIPYNSAEIIVCKNNFHGRTLTTISMSSTEQYKKNFGPFTPGFKIIPYNDLNALICSITHKTVGFIVEPIQGEAGVVIPKLGYLKACKKICEDNNILLLCDEIQTGMGRTGKFLAVEHENFQPDGILLGKALGGGLLPISLFLAKNDIMNVITPGDHGSTFGGNALASFVAVEALNILVDEKLIKNCAELGDYFLHKLKKIKSPYIQEIRGKGLLIGIVINTKIIESIYLSNKLIENRLLNINTRNKVLRLLPPLNITKEQIDDAIDIISRVFIPTLPAPPI